MPLFGKKKQPEVKSASAVKTKQYSVLDVLSLQLTVRNLAARDLGREGAERLLAYTYEGLSQEPQAKLNSAYKGLVDLSRTYQMESLMNDIQALPDGDQRRNLMKIFTAYLNDPERY